MIRWARRLFAGATCVAALAYAASWMGRDDLRFRPSERGEIVILLLLLTLAGLAGVLAPTLRARLPGVEARLQRIPRWVLPVAGFVAWVIGWGVVLHLRDPRWLASGIDWHDAYLLAYSFRFDDPAFSCAARYPLYPALAAGISSLSGLPLDVALQVVSRACGVLVILPLAAIAARLFGRAAAVTGVLLLLAVGTFQHHVDAATPYPLYMFTVSLTLAGLVLAWDGALGWFLLAGVGLGASMATDSKALALMVALAPVMAVVALLAPTGRAWAAAIAIRGLRVLALVAPLWGSYRWMGSLEYTPLTIEDVAAPTLFPSTWSHEDYAAYSRSGYIWGRFHTADQIVHTVQVFREMGELPEQQLRRRQRYWNTGKNLRRNYPAATLGPVWVALGALAVPLVRGWRRAWEPVLQAGAILAACATIVPTILDDYQDRYLVHVIVLVPFLVAGAADGVARLLIDGASAIGRHLRLAVLVGTSIVALAWPGFPHALGNIVPRLLPISTGGAVEREVAGWAREHLAEEDVLLDLTWMMNGCLAAGDRTVVRPPGTYPTSGVAVPAWRGSKPKLPTVKAIYALVGSGEPPTQVQAIPPDAVRTSPDWTKVWTSADGFSDIYQYIGAGQPTGWAYMPTPAPASIVPPRSPEPRGPSRPQGPPNPVAPQ